MKTYILEKGKAYKVERLNYAGNTGSPGALIFKGDTVSVTVIGSQTRPAYDSDMVDLVNGSSFADTPIVLAGMYTFLTLPEFIQIDGTVDTIELVNYVAVEELGALTASPEA